MDPPPHVRPHRALGDLRGDVLHPRRGARPPRPRRAGLALDHSDGNAQRAVGDAEPVPGAGVRDVLVLRRVALADPLHARVPGVSRGMLGRRAVAVLIAGWTLHPLEARACAVCIGWMGGVNADWAYYWSALLLTLVPFAVVMVIGAWIRRALRREARGR